MEYQELNQYLERIDILPDSQESFSLDENEGCYLDNEPFQPINEQQEEPELQSYPFQNQIQQKEENTSPTKQSQAQCEVQSPPAEVQQILFQPTYILRYRKSFYGTKDDTMELNINFKTQLVGYFRELIYLKELTPEEVKHVEEFVQVGPSFTSLARFYEDKEGNQKIRKWCLEFLESGECVRRILSGRCQLKTKLMMIKFIQKMRSNLLRKGDIIKWKDNVKWTENVSQ